MSESRLPRHMPALDGLRGVAILLVILTHTGDGWRRALMAFQDCDNLPPLDYPWWLRAISNDAGFGVQLFFVVSAFTLTSSFVRGTSTLADYAVRRLARVGPGYWLAAIGYTLATGFGPKLLAPDGMSWTDLAVAMAFGSSWQGGAALAVVPGGWSVCAEIGFYLMLPAVLALTRRNWLAMLVLTIGTLLVTQITIRVLYAHNDWSFVTFCRPIMQAPGFLLGMTAALIAMRFRLPDVRSLVPVVLGAAIVVLPLLQLPPQRGASYLVFDIACAVAVAFAAAHPPAMLDNTVMRTLGQVSYSMYLVHFALLPASLFAAELAFPGDGIPTGILHFGISVSATFLVARITYRYIELPFIRWSGGRRATVRPVAT